LELFTIEFLSALAAIVVIDLVLAGDNAIVIALAARNVPRHQQKRAMIWGAGGAVIARSAMTMLVVWLLKIPGLLFVGGAMLVWIAYKLLLQEDGNGNGNGTNINGAGTLSGAIKTIVVADLVMGLDNVLGVAGAAQGSFLLVVLGLLISIPILVWGSSMLLQLVERFPGFVYLGAGVLAVTAAKMITAEPHLKDPLAAYALMVPLLYVVTVFGVLWAGFVKNHRRLESRISARLVSLAQRRDTQASDSRHLRGENAMLRVIVPVDGSRNGQYAARHVIKEFIKHTAMEVHLLNVQPPFSKHIAQFVGRKNREAYHLEKGEKALRPIKDMLDRSGVSYSVHIEVGNKAKVIAETARRLHCDHIVMGTSRKNSLTRMLEDSVTNKVLELTTVPVEVIAGDAVSKLERYAIPAGIGAAVALLALAAAD
jgi:YjbE family integral membrane protein